MDDALRNSDANIGLFAAALSHAVGRDDLTAAYEVETGKSLKPAPRSPLGEMIDQQTGADYYKIRGFADWFAQTQWGSADAPDLDLVLPDPRASA